MSDKLIENTIGKELREEIITGDLILTEIKTSFEENCVFDKIENGGESIIITYLNGQKFEISVKGVT